MCATSVAFEVTKREIAQSMDKIHGASAVDERATGSQIVGQVEMLMEDQWV